MASRTLRIPARLRAVMLGGVATLACSSTSTVPPVDGGPLADAEASAPRDGGHDSSPSTLDGGPCKIKVPKGTTCETTCYNIEKSPIAPYACQVYCSPPKGGPGHCSCNGGTEPPEGGPGFCPGDLNCELDSLSDGGTQVLC